MIRWGNTGSIFSCRDLFSHVVLISRCLYLNFCVSLLISSAICKERGHITLVEIDHEIISKVILPLPLIQEGHLSITGKSMCTKVLINCLA